MELSDSERSAGSLPPSPPPPQDVVLLLAATCTTTYARRDKRCEVTLKCL